MKFILTRVMLLLPDVRVTKNEGLLIMKIEYLSATQIAYVRRTGVYGIENQQMMMDFKRRLQAENIVGETTILGIALDDPTKTLSRECRYDVGLVTAQSKFKMAIKRRTLTGGKYATFKVVHTAIAIKMFYSELGQVIDDAQLMMRNQPIIERYQSVMVRNGYCEMLVPIE